MVDTEIGAMPVDLWALIGATPPLPDGNSPRREQDAARVAPGGEFGAPVAESVSAGGEPPVATWMADAALTRGAPLLAAEPRHEMRRTPERERMVGQGAPPVVHGDARPGAALQRQPVDVATAVMGAVNGEIDAPGDAADLPERAPGPTPAPAAAMAEPDVHELARQVYAHLRRRLAVEWERLG